MLFFGLFLFEKSGIGHAALVGAQYTMHITILPNLHLLNIIFSFTLKEIINRIAEVSVVTVFHSVQLTSLFGRQLHPRDILLGHLDVLERQVGFLVVVGVGALSG